MRRLRGTSFDISCYTTKWRGERRLIAKHQGLLVTLLAQLNAGNHAATVELTRLPETMRSFSHITAENVAKVRARQDELLVALSKHDCLPSALMSQIGWVEDHNAWLSCKSVI
jgi:hypothetical protein